MQEGESLKYQLLRSMSQRLNPPPPQRDIDSILQTYRPKVVERALTLLSSVDDWTTAKVTRWIDPAYVLAEPWSPPRLTDCRELLAAGDDAPAIDVVSYQLGKNAVLYGVTDGMHRTTAAREAGRQVRAKIEGYWRVEPARYVLWHKSLWKREADHLEQSPWHESKDVIAVLIALGVPQVRWSWLRSRWVLPIAPSLPTDGAHGREGESR